MIVRTRGLLLLGCLFGCGESKPSTPIPLPTVDVTDPLALLPADSELVIRVDMVALRKSPLFAKYRTALRDGLIPAFAGCAYDPFDEMTSVTAGLVEEDAGNSGMIVVRGVDRERTLACLREAKTSVKLDHDVIELRGKRGSLSLMAFVDAKTVALHGVRRGTRETFAKALAIGAPLRNNAKYLAAEALIEPGAEATIVTPAGSDLMNERLDDQLGFRPETRGSAISIQITDNAVVAHSTTELANPADAATIAAENPPSEEANEYVVKRFRVEGTRLYGELEITEAQIKKIVELLPSK